MDQQICERASSFREDYGRNGSQFCCTSGMNLPNDKSDRALVELAYILSLKGSLAEIKDLSLKGSPRFDTHPPPLSSEVLAFLTSFERVCDKKRATSELSGGG